MKKSIIFTLICGALILLFTVTETIGALESFGWIFALMVVATVWFNIEKDKEKKEKKKKLRSELVSLDNFTATKKLVGPWGLIAIDDNTQQIAIKANTAAIIKYPYSDIMGCEIIEDGKTTYKKSSIVSRAIVGGVLAGGAGAIIGGLTGENKKIKEIENLDFKIVFKDTKRPSFKIRFFDAWEETNNTKASINISDALYGPIFKKSLNNLKEWKDIIEIIIDRVDSERSTPPTVQLSVTDELIKLSDLKEKGVLTNEEFEQQKGKLLK